MQYRPLGRTDLSIAPLVLGGNVFGWTADEARSFAILDEFFAMGFNAVDTANIYSRWAPGHQGGESETVLGKWMKARGNRQAVTLITKVGGDMGQGRTDLSRANILQAADDSLKRLQTDYIDLYLTHFDDTHTPVEETLGAYQNLIEAGKVRWIGASNLAPERLTESLQASKTNGLPRYEVFQPEYNLYARQGFEATMAGLCEKNELGVITYFALASGFLTGKYRSSQDLDKSVRGDRVEKYLDERGLHILQALDQVADQYGVSQSAIALAWQMHRPVVTAPIASATKLSHLEAFRKAAALELSREDMVLLDNASAYRTLNLS